jgi:hypothetical protein
MDEYLDPSESISYTCEKSNINEDYTTENANVSAN